MHGGRQFLYHQIFHFLARQGAQQLYFYERLEARFEILQIHLLTNRYYRRDRLIPQAWFFDPPIRFSQDEYPRRLGRENVNSDGAAAVGAGFLPSPDGE